MPVTFRCPECGRLISVPKKYVGTTINCPHNGCLVQVRDSAAGITAHSTGNNGRESKETKATTIETLIGAAASEPAIGAAGPKAAGSDTQQSGSMKETRPARSENWLHRNVARFIAPEAAASGVNVAADGRLPELKLQEGQGRKAAQEPSEGTNPLVLIGVLCLSFVMSTGLMLVDFDSPPGSEGRKSQARRQIAAFYQPAQGELEPYQEHLRDAQRAHARGDTAAERRSYRRVLQLLRSEGRGRFASLTRTPREDKELEELLAVLLAED